MSIVKGRIAWLDAAKGLTIALVVSAHCIGGEWEVFFSPIRMPLFFIAAGFTLNLAKWKDRKAEFFWGRVRRILLPYFLLELVFWPIWSVRGMFLPPVGTSLPPLDALSGIFDGNAMSLPLLAMWFLPCFFLAENIFLWVFAQCPEKPEATHILMALCLSVIGYKLGTYAHLPWGLDTALFVQGFLLAGRWLRAVKLESLPLAGCIVIPVLLIAAHLQLNLSFNMAAREYGEYIPLAYASAIGGCILMMRLLQLIVHDSESFLAEWGRRSMAIYLLHPLVQIIISDILLSTIIEGDYGTIFYVWPAGVLIAVTGVLLPVYISKHYGQKPFFRQLGI